MSSFETFLLDAASDNPALKTVIDRARHFGCADLSDPDQIHNALQAGNCRAADHDLIRAAYGEFMMADVMPTEVIAGAEDGDDLPEGYELVVPDPNRAPRNIAADLKTQAAEDVARMKAAGVDPNTLKPEDKEND